MLTAPLLAARIAALAFSVLEPPAITAKASESQLYFLLPPTRVESVCGSDLFALELRTSVGSMAWVCLKADAVSGRLNVTNWGYADGFGGRLIRGPVANDRGVIAVIGQDFVRLDPLTLEQTIIGTMSPPVATVNAGTVIDVPPGIANAVLLNTSDDTQLRTFPGGQFLRTVFAWPQSVNWARQPVGRFLSSTTSLVASRDNEGTVSLIHPDTGAIAQSFPDVVFGNWARVATPSAGGIDSIVTITGQFADQISVDGFAPWSSSGIGGSGDGLVVSAGPVDWTAGEHDVVGLWNYALRVFDPVTMAVRYEEAIPYTRAILVQAQLFPVDVDGDGLQEVFWTDVYGSLYSLPHGGPSRELQGPGGGFQVAGVSGATLVTAETSNTFQNEHLDIVFRDARTLEVKSRRTAAAADFGSEVLAGALPGYEQQVLLTRTNRRIAAESVVDGTPLWERDNEIPYHNDWEHFALPTGRCDPGACTRLLVAANAADTSGPGSYLWLIDATTGETLWQSVPGADTAGGGYQAIAIADINGDGVPDLLDAHYNWPGGYQAEAIDGATFEKLWTKDLGNAFPQAVGAASKGDTRVALLLDGSAELLDPTDGQTLATRPVDTDIYANCCSIRYDAFTSGQGIWVILGGTAVQWLDADFANPAQSIDARGVSSEVSRGRGAMFAAGAEGVYRIQFPRDDIFMDDAED